MVPQLLVHVSGISYGFVGIAMAIVITSMLSQNSNLDAFPTVGHSGFLGSWWSGFKFMTSARVMIQEGYEKHKSAPFKIASRYGWIVVLSDRKHVEELARVSDDELSFLDAVNERMNTEYTLGRDNQEDQNFGSFLRMQLTRKIRLMYPEIRDEIITTFDEVLDLVEDEWKSAQVLTCIRKVICRASNRVFVGLPLCRDPVWTDLNIQYAIDIALAAQVIGLFPTFLKPLVAWFFPGISRRVRTAHELLAPIIKDRFEHFNKPEYQSEKPNDLLSWSIDDNPAITVKGLVTRMIVTNFTAVHTSSNSFTNALLYLAAHPHYIQPLREEVESIVRKEGWSKASVSKMHKVDSFLRECQRIEGLQALDLMRKAVKDYTFSDGTFIPRGTTVGIPVWALHHDEKLYKNPAAFEPLRFTGPGDDGEERAKHRYASTAFDYLAFGHGKHACPGRFFAATELKTMLAHIVVTYDLKLQDNALRPRTVYFDCWILPDPYAEVMFRKRVDRASD